ncbi:hypothetical protein TTHERM_000925521 (macronuclear) [Tetrahymena thermophila SB210]|uniref:Uncharacterized protein n=1 Tax=Tetrahymena thermophila (strain SB210) TaxID=312017 RepID=W7XH89_TETTS|nr:hypothetical protein TTHERM_000925521 [Tetrahymena thermophila SB210]EWS72404.1 hypothetical protein TTHERM_000925521 [Tetrahymena thermophila SB210]|eukprot:XP_012655060.1 hypothetical protein TTHERM_000925521 [Tetrahymena thermophila SB210]
MKQQKINQQIIKSNIENKNQLNQEIQKKKKKKYKKEIQIKQKAKNKLKELFFFKFNYIIKNITIQYKQTEFTQDQVSNLRYQCILIKQNINLIQLHHQYNCHFLNIEEKINEQLVIILQGKMKKKYKIIRNKLINNKTKY